MIRCATCDGWGYFFDQKEKSQPDRDDTLCHVCEGCGEYEIECDDTLMPYEVCQICVHEGRTHQLTDGDLIDCDFCDGKRYVETAHDTAWMLWDFATYSVAAPWMNETMGAASNQITALRAAVRLAVDQTVLIPVHNEEDREWVLRIARTLSAALEYDGIHGSEEMEDLIFCGHLEDRGDEEE